MGLRQDMQSAYCKESYKSNNYHSGYVCIQAKWSIGPLLISGFSTIKQLGELLLPPGWDASLS